MTGLWAVLNDLEWNWHPGPEHPLIHAHGVLLYVVAMYRVVAHIDQALLIDSVAARHRHNATRNTVTSAGFTPANRAA